jgi:cbb3-type cytochrome oxidase maturation protein
MSIIYILIPIAILLTALGVYLFFWAVKSDQFDDLEKQGMSILFDDNKTDNSSTINKGTDSESIESHQKDDLKSDKNKQS